MKLIQQSFRNERRTGSIPVVLLDKGEIPSPEEFHEFLERQHIGSNVRVYGPVDSAEDAQPFIFKQNRHFLAALHELAGAIREEFGGFSEAYVSGKKLRQQVGLPVQQDDLHTKDGQHRRITRYSLILDNSFMGKDGVKRLDTLLGNYLRRDRPGSTHLVPTDAFRQQCTTGLAYRTMLFHQNAFSDLEFSLTADNASDLLSNLRESIPRTAKGIMQLQVYNPQALKKFTLIPYKL